MQNRASTISSILRSPNLPLFGHHCNQMVIINNDDQIMISLFCIVLLAYASLFFFIFKMYIEFKTWTAYLCMGKCTTVITRNDRHKSKICSLRSSNYLHFKLMCMFTTFWIIVLDDVHFANFILIVFYWCCYERIR